MPSVRSRLVCAKRVSKCLKSVRPLERGRLVDDRVGAGRARRPARTAPGSSRSSTTASAPERAQRGGLLGRARACRRPRGRARRAAGRGVSRSPRWLLRRRLASFSPFVSVRAGDETAPASCDASRAQLLSRLRRHGDARGAAAVPVRDRLPDARHRSPRPRTSSRRRSCATTRPAVEAESPKAYLATVTTRLAIDQLRSARARREVYPGEWLPEPLVDDEAVAARRDGRLALARVPAPAREALAGRARRLPAARGLRLPLRGGRADRRQEPRQLPPDPRPGAPARRRGEAPLRRLARGARGGRPPLPGRLGGGRHGGARRAAGARRDGLRRRRRQGAGRAGAARRRRAGGEGADRLGPPGTRARLHAPRRRSSTASRASSSPTPDGAVLGGRLRDRRRRWSSRCGRS